MRQEEQNKINTPASCVKASNQLNKGYNLIFPLNEFYDLIVLFIKNQPNSGKTIVKGKMRRINPDKAIDQAINLIQF